MLVNVGQVWPFGVFDHHAWAAIFNINVELNNMMVNPFCATRIVTMFEIFETIVTKRSLYPIARLQAIILYMCMSVGNVDGNEQLDDHIEFNLGNHMAMRADVCRYVFCMCDRGFLFC